MVLLLALAAALLLALSRLRPPAGTLFWSEFFEAGHVPLFGCFALAMLGLFLTLSGARAGRRGKHYLFAFLATGAAGVLTEAAQFFSPRDADLVDVLRNLAGAALFLGFAATFDPSLGGRVLSPVARPVARVAILLGVAAFFVPAAMLGLLHANRGRACPRLVDFDHFWETRIYVAKEADLALVGLPEPWNAENPTRAARVTFNPGTYPGLLLREMCRDWPGHEVLAFEIYSPLDQPRELRLRIDDVEHDQVWSDRYDRSFIVEPGVNRVRIPLEDIATAPATRRMDLTRINALRFYVHQPPESFTLYFDSFRLE